MATSLIISQPGATAPTVADQIPPQNPARKLTNRQIELLIGRLAVTYVLTGSPDPLTFDRADLRLASAMLGEMLAETEVEVAQ
jgi:hypothetical protein